MPSSGCRWCRRDIRASVKISSHRPADSKARQLLSQAGYLNGKGLEEFGRIFSYRMSRRSKSPWAHSQRDQSKTERGRYTCGIESNPVDPVWRPHPWQERLTLCPERSRKPVADAGYAIQLFFASPSAGGVNNMTNYHNDSVDALWASARTTANPSARAEFIA